MSSLDARRSARIWRAWMRFLRSASVSGLASGGMAASTDSAAGSVAGPGLSVPVPVLSVFVPAEAPPKAWPPAPPAWCRPEVPPEAWPPGPPAGAPARGGAARASGLPRRPFLAGRAGRRLRGRAEGRGRRLQGGRGQAGRQALLQIGAQIRRQIPLAVGLEALLDFGKALEGAAEPFEVVGAVLRQGQPREAIGQGLGFVQHAEAGDAEAADGRRVVLGVERHLAVAQQTLVERVEGGPRGQGREQKEREDEGFLHGRSGFIFRGKALVRPAAGGGSRRPRAGCRWSGGGPSPRPSVRR